MLIETWKALSDEERSAKGVKLHKGFVADEIKILEADRLIKFTISTDSVDRDRDTIAVEGWDFSDFRKNPVVLWAHSYAQPPVARATSIGIEEGKVKSGAIFPEADISPFADTIYRMLKAGYLNATSVGFRPLEWVFNEERRGMDFKKQSLLEFSVVPVPANPQALIEARSDGTITEDDERLYLGWAEEVLDSWHGEKGLWIPRHVAEGFWKQLREERVVKEVKQPELEPEPEHVEPEPESRAKEEEKAIEKQEMVYEGEIIDLDDWLTSLQRGIEEQEDDEPPNLADLDPDELRSIMEAAFRESVTDAVKQQITAVTGRLVD